ncbi:MAG TPA: Rieske (2Fe-2S) protein [Gemmatimonadaceae bacterium]|nr:Rieske (2Fe-2S) protein [Gemmatimonadaceae bacterium]
MRSRREFLGDAARFAAAAAAAGCSAKTKPPLFETTVDVGSLTTDGASLVTSMPGLDGAPILIVRDGSRRFHALSMQCTHEGCPVRPPSQGIITCPCHGSQYDLEGRVRRGPAQLPLARYATVYHWLSKRLTVRVDA